MTVPEGEFVEQNPVRHQSPRIFDDELEAMFTEFHVRQHAALRGTYDRWLYLIVGVVLGVVLIWILQNYFPPPSV